MNDLDHMLNGKGSRQHHQDMIQQAQYIRLTRDIKTTPANNRTITLLHAILIATITKLINSL
jgi:hypothetical protein